MSTTARSFRSALDMHTGELRWGPVNATIGKASSGKTRHHDMIIVVVVRIGCRVALSVFC